MPSVATNAGSAKRETIVPTSAPQPMPTSRPTGMAMNGEYGAPAMPAVADVVAKLALTIPANATTEPTERSIPRVRMTNVMPMARMPLIEVCSRTLEILPAVRKYSLENERIVAKSRKAMNMPYSWITSLRRSEPNQLDDEFFSVVDTVLPLQNRPYLLSQATALSRWSRTKRVAF